jgi:murein DD-endopeptidase MepM/ murein hydrolase activator NlpD
LNMDLYKGHNGIDIVAPWGTPIYAVEGGVVCDVNDNPAGYGKHVRVMTQTKEKIEREWVYAHLALIYVTKGQTVKAGEQIGTMGNTGFVISSSNGAGFWVEGSNKYLGTHLHLGCREYVYDNKGWTWGAGLPKMSVLNYDNGSAGSIDFSKMFYEDPMLGDMQILKVELEKHGVEPWFITFLRALKFFNN